MGDKRSAEKAREFLKRMNQDLAEIVRSLQRNQRGSDGSPPRDTDSDPSGGEPANPSQGPSG